MCVSNPDRSSLMHRKQFGDDTVPVIETVLPVKNEEYRNIFRLSVGQHFDEATVAPKQYAHYQTLGDGRVIAESRAVDRVVARLCGLYGKSDSDQNVVDYVYEVVKDAFDTFAQIVFGEKDAEKKKTNMGTYFGNTLPPLLNALEKQLVTADSGKQYFLGGQVSLADIVSFDFFSQILAQNPTALDSVPHFKALIARVGARPNIAHWVSSRPAGNF